MNFCHASVPANRASAMGRGRHGTRRTRLLARCMVILIGLVLPALGILLLPRVLHAQARVDQPNVPLGRCRGVGPLEEVRPDFCGCTWGYVFYRGAAVAGVDVELAFGSSTRTGVTQSVAGLDPTPHYSESGTQIGAKRNDVMTVTTVFAGTAITRAFRAVPEDDYEQQVNLVLPSLGDWTPVLTGDHGNALLTTDQTLWAAGPAALVALDLTHGVTTTYAPPPGAVTALAAASDGTLWAAGDAGLFRKTAAGWADTTPPIPGRVWALLESPDGGGMWAAGGAENEGVIAYYDGTWHERATANAPVRALDADDRGRLWAGTWGDGGLHQDAAGTGDDVTWSSFAASNGLASDYVYAIAATDGYVWLGTRPYLSTSGPRGGISRHTLADSTWTTFDVANGLPQDETWADAPADVYRLAALDDRAVWAETEAGLYILATDAWWLPEDVPTPEAASSLTGGAALVFATKDAVYRLTPPVADAPGPTVTISSTAPIDVLWHQVFQLQATASVPEDSAIVAWEWDSDRDGPLCTTAEICRVDAQTLSIGAHDIRVRVQDQAGRWSADAATQVNVIASTAAFLPVTATAAGGQE